jgi:predicted nucleic acid-binding protein
MATSWLIDSNVLVYAFFHKPEEEGRHELETRLRYDSRRVLMLAVEGRFNSVVAQQNLLEFLAIVTSPKRVASPVDLPEALRACEAYLSFCTLVTPKASTYLTFESLTTNWKGARERIFDLYLGATALDSEVSNICSCNTKHFRPVSGLTVATPTQLISSLSKN